MSQYHDLLRRLDDVRLFLGLPPLSLTVSTWATVHPSMVHNAYTFLSRQCRPHVKTQGFSLASKPATLPLPEANRIELPHYGIHRVVMITTTRWVLPETRLTIHWEFLTSGYLATMQSSSSS